MLCVSLYGPCAKLLVFIAADCLAVAVGYVRAMPQMFLGGSVFVTIVCSRSEITGSELRKCDSIKI